MDSVLAQTFRDYELIVVDDGSTDDTVAQLALYPVHLVRMEHGGSCAALNAGIAVARGEYVAFLDSDDLWEPEKLTKQVAAGGIWSRTGLRFIDADGRPHVRGERIPEPSGWVAERLLGVRTMVGTSTVMVRRNALVNVGGFDEDMETGWDTDLWLRLALRYPVVSLPEVLVRVRIHAGQHRSERGQSWRGNYLRTSWKVRREIPPHLRVRWAWEALRIGGQMVAQRLR